MALGVTVLFVIVGLMNLLPVVGVSSGAMLERLYGAPVSDRNLLVLLRHRALLLGLVGAFLIAAGFCASLRTAAGVAGLVSMLSFVALAPPSAPVSEEIKKVSRADVVGSALLVAALVMRAFA
jgi:hypothetical protein